MHSKTRWAALLAIVIPFFLLLLNPSRYRVPLSIRYAHQHWNWTLANGQRGWATLNGHDLFQRRVPHAGWFQPQFQCAEFVGRSLAAGGVPIPLVSQQSPRWPVLVNVDRLSYFLLTRGFAQVIPLSALQPGDMVLFRYAHLGQSASPTVWSHTALIVHAHPLLVDAHNTAENNLPLAVLSRPAWELEALQLSGDAATAIPKASLKSGEEVAIAWRDLWSSTGTHLFWGEIYRVKHAGLTAVTLFQVPGTVPTIALSPVASTPTLSTPAGPAVVLGVTPQGAPMVATAKGPIPRWTGHPYVPTLPRQVHAWHPRPPAAVKLLVTTHLSPVPGYTTIAKAFIPRGSYSVMDATVTIGDRAYAQLEWRGAQQGLGYVPLQDLQRVSLPITILQHPIKVLSPTGAPLTLPHGMAVVRKNHRDAYAGRFLSPLT